MHNQSVFAHVPYVDTSNRNSLTPAFFYRVDENPLWPAIQQDFTLPVVDLFVHPVASLEEEHWRSYKTATTRQEHELSQ